jgi:arylsulfatase A-like enzyme
MSLPSKHRREFLRQVAGSVAAATVLSGDERVRSASADHRPNILMIVADDQRTDTIAALGNSHIQTPNLDRLVNEGFTFTRARNMGSQVGAVCIAARAMIHTGRSLFRAPHQMPARFPTLPQTFRQAGYTTFGCGKWHNERPSFARGFGGAANVFFGGMNQNQYRVRVHDFDPTGRYGPKTERIENRFSSELFADATVEFLGSYKDDRPFFAYCAFTSPHDPRTPPPPYSTLYDPSSMPLPANFLPRHPFDNGELRVRDELLAPFPRTPEDTRKQLCDYYGMISSQDAQVGRILKALHDSGRAENTIVLYTGDHGLAIGSHGLFGKQNVYEHSVGVPLIVHGPQIRRGQSDAFAYGMDILPTLCRLTGVSQPDNLEGQPLDGIIAGSTASVRSSTFHAYIAHDKTITGARTQHAVNDGRWKYIRYRVRGKTTVQLFDLHNDPAETDDLSSEAASRAEVDRLDKMLTDYQHALDEPAVWRAA